jgi:hypothetical protein
VALRDAYTAVTEEYRHSIQRNSCKKQFDRECVSKPMRMPTSDIGQLKKALQSALPFSLRTAYR